jgi:hypothetical protein
MKFKELLRREALAAVAVASLSIPAMAQTAEPADTTTGQHHGNKRLLREMAKTDGDPTGEVAVPHHHPSQFAVYQAGDDRRGASEADRFREPKSPLNMKLFKFKPDD